MLLVMVRGVLVVILALSGCSLRNVNRATLVASTVSLACDWGQTRAVASTGWEHRYEDNPMLGSTPTTAQVDTYFLAAAITNAFVWLVMPAKLRSVVPAGVVVVQADSIANNHSELGNMCGLGGIKPNPAFQ